MFEVKVQKRPGFKEHQAQATFIEWCNWNQGKYPELNLLYAIPNGGYRPLSTGNKMKAEGVRRGVPDLCLPVPRGPWHGLYIEFKSNRTCEATVYQWEYMELLCEVGFCVAVVYSPDEAIEMTAAYLELPPVAAPRPNGVITSRYRKRLQEWSQSESTLPELPPIIEKHRKAVLEKRAKWRGTAKRRAYPDRRLTGLGKLPRRPQF